MLVLVLVIAIIVIERGPKAHPAHPRGTATPNPQHPGAEDAIASVVHGQSAYSQSAYKEWANKESLSLDFWEVPSGPRNATTEN